MVLSDTQLSELSELRSTADARVSQLGSLDLFQIIEVVSSIVAEISRPDPNIQR